MDLKISLVTIICVLLGVNITNNAFAENAAEKALDNGLDILELDWPTERDKKEAEEHFKEALRLDPEMHEACGE